MKDSTRRTMDLKLGFCVITLNLLILLVAYGTEARKMAEGDMRKRLNLPIVDEVVDMTNVYIWISDNQGETGYGKRANVQVIQLSSNNKDLENNNQGENAQLARPEKSDHFWIYDKQGDKNYQQAKKESDHFWIYDKQGDKNYQQAKKESAHLWIYDKQGENYHEQAKTKNDHEHTHSSSHMDHMDPSVMVFFLMDDLKLGNSINVHFPRRDLSPSPSFLPKEEADSIPFSLKELPNLLQQFNFSRNSPQAKAMEDTLRECEVPPIKGETKYCATSSEALLDFVQGIMGEKIQVKALSTTHFTNSAPLLQRYTILDVPQEVAAPKMVACHTMPYAYAIYYCHYTISKSKVFKVSLSGENGDRVEAIAVCHLDTSAWSPNHVSFRVLGILPGTSPICHFFPSDNLVWVPKITSGAQDH